MNIETKDIMSRKKIFAHKNRLLEWLETNISRPITAEIDITNKCNYSCLDCAGGRGEYKSQLSEENIKKIIDEISPTIKGLLFTGGGEPLKNPAIDESVRYAKEKGPDVGVITNGFYLQDNTRLENFVSNARWIRISLDAHKAPRYAKRKKVPEKYFKQVIDNITNLVQKRDELQTNCTIGLGYLTKHENFLELEKVVLLAKSLGVDNVQFRPYHDSTVDLRPEIERTKSHETTTFKVLYPSAKYTQEKNNYDYKQCFGDEFRIVISSNGDLYPDCFSRGKKDLIYGNILQQPFKEIWTSEKKQKIFEEKLSQQNIHLMSRTDSLNQALWNLYQNPKEYDLNALEQMAKTIDHKNFI